MFLTQNAEFMLISVTSLTVRHAKRLQNHHARTVRNLMNLVIAKSVACIAWHALSLGKPARVARTDAMSPKPYAYSIQRKSTRVVTAEAFILQPARPDGHKGRPTEHTEKKQLHLDHLHLLMESTDIYAH